MPLSYGASGNLIAKGDMGFEYDFHNRLIRATKAGQEIARYTYDAFGRRIEKEVGGVTQTTVWSGWQPVETYRDGVLAERQVYGRGIDEVTELERDLDGDGTLETQATPWYDSTGNPVLLADSAGKVIERYSYTPFGEQEIRVDATPPEIEQVRVRDDEVWLELSEEVQREVFRQQVENGAVLLEDTSQDPPVPLEIHLLDAAASTGGASSASAAQAVAQSGASTVSGHGRTPDAERFRDPSRRRLILDVTSPPAADTPLHLVVPAGALKDLFLNEAAEDFAQDLAWPTADTVVFDSAPPQVHAVGLRDGHLELTFSEEPDQATTTAIDAGTPLTWTLSADRYTLRSDETLAGGEYTLAVATTLTDLAGTALPATFTLDFTVDGGTPNADYYDRPDPRLTETSAVGNQFAFHGLQKDIETGLLYVRNRYYDPETGRFVTADPLGYKDGPSCTSLPATTRSTRAIP